MMMMMMMMMVTMMMVMMMMIHHMRGTTARGTTARGTTARGTTAHGCQKKRNRYLKMTQANGRKRRQCIGAIILALICASQLICDIGAGVPPRYALCWGAGAGAPR